MYKMAKGSSSLRHFYLLCLFIAGSCSPKEKKQEHKVKEKTALTLIKNDDCLNCHNIEDKSVGPSYIEISRRYDPDTQTINRLANKIIEGGGGLWGSQQMSKHPFLEKEDAIKIVKWILSLGDSTINIDPLEHIQSLSLADVFNSKDQALTSNQGLELSVYLPEEASNFDLNYLKLEDTNSLEAKYLIRISTIHFTEQLSFEPFNPGTLIQAKGNLRIKEKGDYFFKLAKGGQGRVYLDGEKIVNEKDTDNEVLKELIPGTYPIRIEYVIGEDKNLWSLQWIAPDQEYFEVIPPAVFSVDIK